MLFHRMLFHRGGNGFAATGSAGAGTCCSMMTGAGTLIAGTLTTICGGAAGATTGVMIAALTSCCKHCSSVTPPFFAYLLRMKISHRVRRFGA